jgi:hypothetical protein
MRALQYVADTGDGEALGTLAMVAMTGDGALLAEQAGRHAVQDGNPPQSCRAVERVERPL